MMYRIYPNEPTLKNYLNILRSFYLKEITQITDLKDKNSVRTHILAEALRIHAEEYITHLKDESNV